VGVAAAVVIGAVAGVLVVGSVMLFDRIKIDDPVGAISVHLVCGIWGTLAVGIFSVNPEHSFLVQLVGVACYGVFTFACAFGLFGALKLTMGIRVSEAEELEGLDLGEHGMHAYDLALGPGWLEQPPGIPARPASAAAPSLAPSESG
jgi:Amt family ammonium transporter